MATASDRKGQVEGNSVVEHTHKGRTVAEKSETYALGVVPLEGSEPAVELTFELGRTINLGDYNGVKAYVGIRFPVTRTDEAIEAGAERAQRWVERKLASLVERAAPAVAAADRDPNPFR